MRVFGGCPSGGVPSILLFWWGFGSILPLLLGHREAFLPGPIEVVVPLGRLAVVLVPISSRIRIHVPLGGRKRGSSALSR